MLLDELTGYAPGRLPMHMPGHKRNTALADYLKALRVDLEAADTRSVTDDDAPLLALSWDGQRYVMNAATRGFDEMKGW